MAGEIFICYRREDSLAQAHAMAEPLRNEFGKDGVFMDLKSVNYGDDFVKLLDQQLGQCLVMLVLIGPKWLDAHANGTGYLDRPGDFVRLEVCAALTNPKVLVLPVLLNTKMPSEDELPPAMRQLTHRHGMPFRLDCFGADMRELIASLRKILTDSTPARPAWASDNGTDGFGYWAEFRIDRLVQRLRWITPGEFLMGSPHDEPERSQDEGTQHRVRLSRGFWLADTVCTQAMWQAVMNGQNPAHFKNNFQNPVEQISHDNALQFLAQLRERVGRGAEPVLPTEAQWEYACRAGTTTPFSFGRQITSEQVNHNANLPYGDGPLGLYRKRTVPVKSLPPNPSGLYEMHGNVWEWCADGAGRLYPTVLAGPVIEDPVEPVVPTPEAKRALRGGSWNDSASGVRSACRFNFPRVFWLRTVGFRLAMRHSG